MSYMRKAISVSLMTLTLLTLAASVQAEVLNSVIAHVGNRIITEFDVQNLDPRQYKEVMEIKEDAYRARKLEEYTAGALDYLINQEIVSIAADREGIRVKDTEVDMAINDILTRNKLTIPELQKALEAEGMSMAKYRFQLKNDILNSRVRSQVLMPKIVVVERDLRQMVDEQPDEYPLHDKYEVRILLTQNKKALDAALKEVKKGLDFEEAVKRYSIDKTATNGGYMGWIEVDLLSDSMKAAMKAAKPGDVTKPFEINAQHGVFKVQAFKSKYDFDNETRAKLTNSASEKIFGDVFKSWLERNRDTIVVMKKAGVK